LQFSGGVSEFIIEDLYGFTTKLFHDPTVFDIQYSLLQNNKPEIKLYLLSTGTIDHDELFFRNLLREQVYVFFLFVKFSIVLQIPICGQAI
jgi:hypothetical protein